MIPEITNLVWGADEANTKINGIAVNAATTITFGGKSIAASSVCTYVSGRVAIKLPADLRSLAIQATGGNAAMVNSDYVNAGATTGHEWTLESGSKESLDGIDFAGETVYFYAASGVTLEIRCLLFN